VFGTYSEPPLQKSKTRPWRKPPHLSTRAATDRKILSGPRAPISFSRPQTETASAQERTHSMLLVSTRRSILESGQKKQSRIYRPCNAARAFRNRALRFHLPHRRERRSDRFRVHKSGQSLLISCCYPTSSCLTSEFLKPHLQLLHSRVQPTFHRTQRQIKRIGDLTKSKLFKLLHHNDLAEI